LIVEKGVGSPLNAMGGEETTIKIGMDDLKKKRKRMKKRRKGK
jgi:hypothetical protein